MLDALNVVVSTIEHSNVTGDVGGFAVKATCKNTASDASANDVLGDAGGFAGKISGGHIQDSNANNFSYIIGQITAGGYVGDLEPGNVANVLGDTGILGGLVDVSDTLASLAEDFVPTTGKQLYDLCSLRWCSSCRCGFHNTGTTRYGRRLCRA
ncbi:MAG: hypothetical protein ACLUJR_11735 [Mediterraneibacter gnavus]